MGLQVVGLLVTKRSEVEADVISRFDLGVCESKDCPGVLVAHCSASFRSSDRRLGAAGPRLHRRTTKQHDADQV